MTNREKISMKKSEEANLNQLELARSQGKAYVKALRHMVELVADHGEEKKAGDYIVAYALEKAEGMYHFEHDKLKWKGTGKTNQHVEISIRDAADDRFVYGAEIYVTLYTKDNHQVGRFKQKLLWHPWLPHYGRNWNVPGSGDYSMKVEIMPPTMPRHDEKNGRRFEEKVVVIFDNVPIKVESKT